eukprot:comp20189_c0_seq1/m.25057 comp20189_c0_seq1/g.25057  ORF comp20189_c0_seq1/g.25057 comp20189_c0_seq1/m.25057 type:complete len:299 (-) comp20189_c0_seq1:286-1182(-)
MATNRRETSKGDVSMHENKLSSGRQVAKRTAKQNVWTLASLLSSLIELVPGSGAVKNILFPSTQRRRKRMKAKRTQRTLIRKVAANMPRDERGEVRYLAGTAANGARQVNLPRTVRRQRRGRHDSEENTPPDHVATLADVTLVVAEDFTQTSVVSSTLLGVQKSRNNSWQDVNTKGGSMGGAGAGKLRVGGNDVAGNGEGGKMDLETEVSEVRRQIMLLLGEEGETLPAPGIRGGEEGTKDCGQPPVESAPGQKVLVQDTSEESSGKPDSAANSLLDAQEQAAAALAAMVKLKFVPKT